MGFDEIQFDYIRLADKTMKDVVLMTRIPRDAIRPRLLRNS